MKYSQPNIFLRIVNKILSQNDFLPQKKTNKNHQSNLMLLETTIDINALKRNFLQLTQILKPTPIFFYCRLYPVDKSRLDETARALGEKEEKSPETKKTK